MEKTFPIIIVIIAIVGFSSSAYFFSQTNITIDSPISLEMQGDNSLMQEIESCIEQNLAGESSIALNSFTTTLLHDLKVRAQATESIDELEDILEQVYSTTTCKP